MHAANPKPFTIPELKTWYGGKGSFVPTKASRIVYTGNDKRVTMARGVCRRLPEDIQYLAAHRERQGSGR